MKILVLGGTGAMGADLVKILAAGTNHLTVTSRSPRSSQSENINFVQGDAHNISFLQSLLSKGYDAVIDFMAYSTKEFKSRRDLFLSSTTQYLFFSSSRVYADSAKPITEDSPRLLDVTTDEEYLRTDEYALAKARQEDLLRKSGKTNWTIIRPYITYNDHRLQLGVFEKELWLYRALNGQTVIIPKDILSHTTTLSWGKDVAQVIAALVGNPQAHGQVVHITTERSIRWSEVLELYQRVLYDCTGSQMKVKLIDSSEQMGWAMENHYQVIYDRLYDRKFDNSKRNELAGRWDFTSPEEGLERCLREFLNKPGFLEVPVRHQAWMDLKNGDRASLTQFNGYADKLKYLIGRYTPYFAITTKAK